jgi:hypothetical protein
MQKNLATTRSSALAGDNGGTCAIQAAVALRDDLLRSRYAAIEIELERLLAQIGPAIGRKTPALHR